MISFSDFVSRIEYYEKRSEGTGISERDERERERGKFVKRGKKRKGSSCRVRGSTPLPFSLFRRKKKEERKERGGVDEARIFIHSFFSHGPRPLDSSTQTCANRRTGGEERPLHPEYRGARELSAAGFYTTFVRSNNSRGRARARKHNQTRRVLRRRDRS